MTFKDHFSKQAAGYAQYRPTYPAEVYAFLADLAPSTAVALDCGTGNGQVAVALAEHFERVIAADAGAAQLANAQPHPRVDYHQAPAERLPVVDGSVDLVTVGQAAHWFDLDRFYAEVRRVCKPGGVLALWAYALFECTPEVDAVVNGVYEALDPFWPPERNFVDSGYQKLPFPFDEIPGPRAFMEGNWSAHQVLGYLGTWSAVQRYKDKHGTDPLDPIRQPFFDAWGDADQPKIVRWPLHFRITRFEG